MSFPVINLVKTGNNIKRIAKENGYSADKIRAMLGISDRSNVYKWFRGEVKPHHVAVAQWTRATVFCNHK